MQDASFQSYRDLRVWQEAMKLAELCYVQTKGLPREEQFGLTAQMRRAAVSIPANIAEGWGRDNSGSYIQFLRIAQGSLKELETHVLLAERVLPGSLPDTGVLLNQLEAVGKMLRGLIRSLQKDQ